MILSKSYKEVINKIHVDDAMKQRILQNIEQEQRSSSKDNRGEKNIFHYFQYKKLSVCAAVVVCCFAVSSILVHPQFYNQIQPISIIWHQPIKKIPCQRGQIGKRQILTT